MDKYNAPPKPKPGSGRGQRIARENMEKKRQEQADEQADKQTDNNQGKASSPGPSERLLRLRKAHHFPFAQQPLAPGTSQDVERTSRVIEPVPGGYKPKFLLEDERTEPFHSIDDYPMPKKHIPGYDTYNKVQGRIEQLMEGGWTEVDARMCVLQDEIDPVVRGKYRQESLRLKQQSTEVTASVDTSSKGKKRLARDTSSESDYTPSESTPSEGSDSDSDYRPQREDHDARAMGKGKHKASDVASDHEAEETIPSTDISDRRSSDVIVPLEHIPALVDAVIASKQPGAKQFDHNAFLRRIGCSGSAVVIDNTHGKAWKEHLKNKNLPKKFFNQVYKKLYRMQKSNLEKNREKMRIGNLTSQQIDRNREKAREVNMTPENIRRKREKDLLRIRAMRSKAKQSKARKKSTP